MFSGANFPIFNPLSRWLIFGIVAFVIALVSALYGAGYYKGRSDGRISQLKATVQAHENRKSIDQAVDDLNGYDLCRDIGGLPDECAELRGLDQAAEGQ